MDIFVSDVKLPEQCPSYSICTKEEFGYVAQDFVKNFTKTNNSGDENEIHPKVCHHDARQEK